MDGRFLWVYLPTWKPIKINEIHVGKYTIIGYGNNKITSETEKLIVFRSQDWSWKCFDQAVGVSKMLRNFLIYWRGSIRKHFFSKGRGARPIVTSCLGAPWPSCYQGPLFLPHHRRAFFGVFIRELSKWPRLGILDSISLLLIKISIWNAKTLIHRTFIWNTYYIFIYVMHIYTHSPHNNCFTELPYQGLWCTCSTSRRFRFRLGAHAASSGPETFPTPKEKTA